MKLLSLIAATAFTSCAPTAESNAQRAPEQRDYISRPRGSTGFRMDNSSYRYDPKTKGRYRDESSRGYDPLVRRGAHYDPLGNRGVQAPAAPSHKAAVQDGPVTDMQQIYSTRETSPVRCETFIPEGMATPAQPQ